MRDHFGAIRVIQAAIVRGDIAGAKKSAEWLAGHKPHAGATGWEPHLERVRGAAARIAGVNEISEAAAFTADLAGQCASCHLATRAITSFSWEPPPEREATLRNQMQRHQWAAERMWEGIVGPSDARWDEGVAACAEGKLDVAGLGGGGAEQQRGVEAAIAFVAGQLRRAATAKTLEERTVLYGELLSGCASCHALTRPTP